MNNFEASSNHKPVFRNFNPTSGNADTTIDELSTLSNRQWFLYNNSGFARGIVETSVNSAVGTGLVKHPTIDRHILGLTAEQADKWQRNTKARFDIYCKSKEVDFYRLSDFTQLQQQALTTMLVDGDAIGIMTNLDRESVPNSVSVKLIEGRQLSNKDSVMDSEKLAGGVGLDKNGISEYHISKKHPNSIDFSTVQEWVVIKAYSGIRQNIVHLMDKKRAGQRRGIGFLAPVIENLLQLKRMTEAELTSVITTSMLVAFIKSDKRFEDEDEDGIDDIEYDSDHNEYKLGNGTIIRLDSGEEMQMFDPKKRNDTFVPFMNSVIEEICAATQIPPEVLVKKFTSSYSASRGALLEMWKFIKRLRHTLVSDFAQPIYETWLLHEILEGRIKAKGFLTDYYARKAWSGGLWHGDPQGLLNPQNEVKASILAIDNNLSTYSTETQRLNGGNFDQNIERLTKEREEVDNSLIKEKNVQKS